MRFYGGAPKHPTGLIGFKKYEQFFLILIFKLSKICQKTGFYWPACSSRRKWSWIPSFCPYTGIRVRENPHYVWFTQCIILRYSCELIYFQIFMFICFATQNIRRYSREKRTFRKQMLIDEDTVLDNNVMTEKCNTFQGCQRH